MSLKYERFQPENVLKRSLILTPLISFKNELIRVSAKIKKMEMNHIL